MRKFGRRNGAVTWLVVAAIVGVFLACGKVGPAIPTCAPWQVRGCATPVPHVSFCSIDIAPLSTVSVVSPDEVWMAGEYGRLLRLSGSDWELGRDSVNPDTSFTKIVMLSSDEGWGVGTYGVVHYTQGEWQPVLNGPRGCWSSLAMVSRDEIWAVGSGIAHFSEGIWTAVRIPTRAILTDVAMVSPDEGWAVGSGGTLLHYVGGASGTPAWTQVSSPTSDNLYSLDMLSASEGWAVGGASILHYTDGAWHSLHVSYGPELLPGLVEPPVNLRRVAMASATDGWAMGDAGLILHYDGDTWNLVPSPTDLSLRDIALVGSSNGWTVGSDNIGNGIGQAIILRLRQGRWTPVNSPLNTSLNAFSPGLYGLAMASPQDGWAVGAGGMILQYDGTDWKKVSGWQRNPTLYSIAMVSLDEGWAVGEYGTILHYRNGEWALQHSDFAPLGGQASAAFTMLHGVAMVSADEGWAVGDSGNNAVILHYSNGQWAPVPDAPTEVSLRGVAMVSAGEGWAVGFSASDRSGVILHYTGRQWQSVQTNVNAQLFGIAMMSPRDGWIAGSAEFGSAVFLHYTSGQWVESTYICQGCGADSVSMVSPTEGWAVGDGAVFHDVNNHWTPVIAPHVTPLAAPYLQIVVMVSPDEGWAAGALAMSADREHSGAAMLHYVHGHWTDAMGSLRDLSEPLPDAGA